MDNMVPADVKQSMDRAKASVADLKKELKPLLELDKVDLKQKAPEERAQIHLAMASAACSLFATFLKTRGMDPNEHAMKKDKERVQVFKGKVEKAVSSSTVAAGPNQVLDVAAASRFIEHAVPDLTPAQRRKVREAGERGRQKQSAKKREAERGAKEGVRKKPFKQDVKLEVAQFLEEAVKEAAEATHT